MTAPTMFHNFKAASCFPWMTQIAVFKRFSPFCWNLCVDHLSHNFKLPYWLLNSILQNNIIFLEESKRVNAGTIKSNYGCKFTKNNVSDLTSNLPNPYIM